MAHKSFNALLDRSAQALMFKDDVLFPTKPKYRRDGRRLGGLIRRQSMRYGRDQIFWRPMAQRQATLILRAAHRFELTARIAKRDAKKGSWNGPLGAIGLEVLRVLVFDFLDYRSGQCDPSYETLAARLGRSRSAIIDAAARLRRHGFLDWVRRYVEEPSRGQGPQVKQTSNAYRICMPQFVKNMLGFFAEAPPTPLDDAARRDAWRKQRDGWEFEAAGYIETDRGRVEPNLFAALEKLALAMDRSGQ